MFELVIPARFNGPPKSGNGGWTAGALAAQLGNAEAHGPVRVTLRTPPPLETPMTVRTDGVGVLLEHAQADGATLVAEAEEVDEQLAVPDVVDGATAQAASATHPDPDGAWFGTCFVCGADRAEGDGLRILPGRVPGLLPGDDRVAAPWTPHASTWAAGTPEGHASLACTWAALDCAGGWSDDLLNRPMVLGRMTAQVHALPRLGEPHVVVGQLLRREGRRSFSATSLRDADGRLLASAEHVWFAVDPAMFG